jgi:hypothetical protein
VAQYGLTEAEQAVLKMPGEFFRAFEALPQLHPADLEEAAFHVHALGRIVAMRAAQATAWKHHEGGVVSRDCNGEGRDQWQP